MGFREGRAWGIAVLVDDGVVKVEWGDLLGRDKEMSIRGRSGELEMDLGGIWEVKELMEACFWGRQWVYTETEGTHDSWRARRCSGGTTWGKWERGDQLFRGQRVWLYTIHIMQNQEFHPFIMSHRDRNPPLLGKTSLVIITSP